MGRPRRGVAEEEDEVAARFDVCGAAGPRARGRGSGPWRRGSGDVPGHAACHAPEDIVRPQACRDGAPLCLCRPLPPLPGRGAMAPPLRGPARGLRRTSAKFGELRLRKAAFGAGSRSRSARRQLAAPPAVSLGLCPLQGLPARADSPRRLPVGESARMNRDPSPRGRADGGHRAQQIDTFSKSLESRVNRVISSS